MSEVKKTETAQDGMSIFEHLGELRKRIIYVLIIFLVGLIIGLFVANPIYQYLVNADQAKDYVLNAFSFWDGIGIYMKISMGVSLVLSIPAIVYQVWAFVSPGLREEERKASLKYVPFVFILFIAGILFAYFIIFPMALAFSRAVTTSMGLKETYGITQYFSFMFTLVIPMALLFELPVLIMFLTKIRVLNPLRLRKMRKVAYFVLVLIAVVITPPDFISDFLVTIPLVVLYEFSVYLSSLIYRKQLAADAEIEKRYS
ncbi:twin-arginine translocase subunit TatC [Paenibacillus crassostreae]|uniref:Sec-independent protein translocase protein TatC n=1 Tax=Paenibacillus crassostreae TaxID=1763538 RepID=A0A162KMU4_9BACL|nr:twin-arginine translocase subunit TatC [Paenibacillus crassostreae]AOZ92296.1 twin arginine-targeting protein translocase TatC [Paenibacillus crassostreae]OAB71013.1 preprotein translocase subunit TatC [Paenibacillus crassostreae]